MNDSHEVNRRVAELIRRARMEAGMTQADLAAKAGFSRASVANMEVGAQSLSVYQLIRLADALGIEPERLLPETAEASVEDKLYATYEAIVGT